MLWAVVSASSRTRDLQGELDDLRQVILRCDDVDCTGSLQAVSLVGSLSPASFLTVFGVECGRTGLPRLCHPGSLRYDRLLSSFVIHHFSLIDKDHRVALTSVRLSHSSSFSPGRFDMFAETRCKYHRRAARACLVCHQSKKKVLTMSNALAKTNSWLTHQRLHHES